MDALKPRWSSWSYLLYAGAFVLFGAAGALLSFLSSQHGAGTYALFSFLVFLAFAVAAGGLGRSGAHPIAAGLFAYVSVGLFAAFLLALWLWFGWLSGSTSEGLFSGFHPARLGYVLVVLAAAVVALRMFRFPLLMTVVVATAYVFVTDLISGGGDWSAVVTFVIGLVFLASASVVDGGPNRSYGMWLHVGAGLAIGGSLLWFLHHGHFEWALIVVAGLVYIRFSEAFGRASWAVLGSIGILAAATHYTTSWSHAHVSPSGASAGGSRAWVPAVVFGAAGALLFLAGGTIARRSAFRGGAGSVSG
jgi:hypothetical protein